IPNRLGNEVGWSRIPLDLGKGMVYLPLENNLSVVAQSFFTGLTTLNSIMGRVTHRGDRPIKT
ncbi:MAG TPA: hypothetical protein V6D27_03765, partial [Vampirovibrionales bacterium]